MHTLKTRIDSVLSYRGCIYFFDRVCNSIWQSDVDMNHLSFLRCIDQDLEIKSFSSFGIFGFDDSIYIGSQTSTIIVEYRIGENRFYKYESTNDYGNVGCMYNIVSYARKIFLLPTELNNTVISFDMHKRNFEKRSPISDTEGKAGFISQQDENLIYIPEFGTNNVYEYDLKELSERKFKFSSKATLSGACTCAGKVYATDTKNDSLRILCDEKEFEVSMESCKGQETYGRIIKCDKYLVALPRFGSKIYLFDTLNEKSIKIDIPLPEQTKKNNSTSLFFGCYVKEGEIYFLPWLTSEIYVLNMRNFTIEKKELNFSLNKAWIERFPIMLEKEMKIEDYLTALKDDAYMCRRDEVNKKFGFDIYSKVINL